jgi:hypothetical protein
LRGFFEIAVDRDPTHALARAERPRRPAAFARGHACALGCDISRCFSSIDQKVLRAQVKRGAFLDAPAQAGSERPVSALSCERLAKRGRPILVDDLAWGRRFDVVVGCE